MTTYPLKIWSNVKYLPVARELLRAVAAEHTVIFSQGPGDAEANAQLVSADIAFGQPPTEPVRQSATLRWVQLDSAGYDRFDTPAARADLQAHGTVVTNSSSVYDEPCAQHALALLLAHARKLPASFANQATTHGWPMLPIRAESALLCEQTVLLLGFGAIARRLAELLAPLRMKVVAVRRHKTGAEPIPIIGEAELADYLPQADHVINILPASPDTQHYVNAARLAAMKPGAAFYNIGRGVTVDQDALLDALQSGHLAAAYLDVTDPEPLPPDHPLWTAPNCFITPHTAGGHIGEFPRLVRLFLENLRRFTAGEELLGRVV